MTIDGMVGKPVKQVVQTKIIYADVLKPTIYHSKVSNESIKLVVMSPFNAINYQKNGHSTRWASSRSITQAESIEHKRHFQI